MKLTTESINDEFKASMAKLAEQYGNYFNIPSTESAFVSEVARAKHACLAGGSTTLDPTIMQQYSIMRRVIEHLCGGIPEIERQVKYADRRRRMEEWCADNIDAIVTPNDIAEVGEVSYATAIKFINDRIDLFRKVERGKYLVRNLRGEQE